MNAVTGGVFGGTVPMVVLVAVVIFAVFIVISNKV